MVSNPTNYILRHPPTQRGGTDPFPVRSRAADAKCDSRPRLRKAASAAALKVTQSLANAAVVACRSLGIDPSAYIFDPLLVSSLTLGLISLQVLNVKYLQTRFENQTGYPIESIYLVPTDSKDWGPDVLNDRDRLVNGEWSTLRIADDPTAGRFDVKIRFLGGGEWSWTKAQAINLRSVIGVRVDGARLLHIISDSDERDMR